MRRGPQELHPWGQGWDHFSSRTVGKYRLGSFHSCWRVKEKRDGETRARHDSVTENDRTANTSNQSPRNRELPDAANMCETPSCTDDDPPPRSSRLHGCIYNLDKCMQKKVLCFRQRSCIRTIPEQTSRAIHSLGAPRTSLLHGVYKEYSNGKHHNTTIK